MTLLTIFSAPKPFADPKIAMLQGNAIASWSRLVDVEVCLLGDEVGIAEEAKNVGGRHLRGVGCNSRRTPLVSSMISLAREHGAGDLLCLVNSDIILMSDLVTAAARVCQLKEKFVLLGRRWDLDVETPIRFDEVWEDRLRAEVRLRGRLHRPAGSDLFLFPRPCYMEVPDFAVGRAGWDNWMIYHACKEGWAVIDGTPSIAIIHQNHDYGHLPGGTPHYAVPETDENIRLAGGDAAIRFTIVDATDRLEHGRLTRPGLSYLRFMRGIELLLRRVFGFLPAGMTEEVVRPRRWKKRLLRLLGKHP
jgi:hypothetical protein